MKRKSTKLIQWILSLFLLVVLLAGAVSGSAMKGAQCEAAYKLTEEQLFMQCPDYLENEVTEKNIKKCWSAAQLAMDDVSSEEESIAVIMDLLKKGGTYAVQGIGQTFGLTDSQYNKFNNEMAKEVLREYMKLDDSISNNVEETIEGFKIIENTYDLGDKLVRQEYVRQLAASGKYINDKDVIEEITDKAFEKITKSKKYLSYVGEGLDVSLFITQMFEMQEVELSALDDLIELQRQDSDLYEGLVNLRTELNENMLDRFLNTYCTDWAIEKIGEKCIDFGVTTITGSYSVLLTLSVEFGIWIYEQSNPTVENIVYSNILYNYTQTSNSAFEKLKMQFRLHTATTDDIQKLKNAYEFHLVCLKLWLNEAKECTNDKAKIQEVKMWYESIGTKLTTEDYIEECLKKATSDINKGILVLDGSSTIYKTEDGTIIDENYDSTASIAAKFAEIQKVYVPNVGQTWTENWGGAIQCFGFARMVFSKLFGCEMPSAYVYNARYQYTSENNVDLIGQLVGDEVTAENVKTLAAQGKLGDIIQACGATYGQHTMVFVSADSDGIKVYDCNANLHGISCEINQWTISYDTLANWYGTASTESANGISLYRASNYAKVYGSGEDLFYDDTVNFVIDENGVLTKYNGWQQFVEIPDTVTAIGENAFRYNTTMVSVEIPDTVRSIGNYAFEECTSLIGIVIPDSVESIGYGVFDGCSSLRTAVLPQNSSFKIIKESTFTNCNALKEIKIPESVVEIENAAFKNTGLVEIIMPNTITKIGDDYGGFYGSGGAFQSCSNLEIVHISKALEYMGAYTFADCTSLNNVVLPKSIKSVGYYSSVFSGCSALKNITFEEGTITIPEKILAGCSSIEYIDLPYSITKIEASAFSGCTQLKEIEIPDSVTSIGGEIYWDGTFEGCTNLEKVHLPKELEYLGSNCFDGCKKLNNVEIPKKLKQLGYYGNPFIGCTSLENVSFEKGTEVIIDGIFRNCPGIKKIEIPSSVTKIGASAYAGCSNIEAISLPETLIEVGNRAFANCKGVKEVVIPDSVTSMGTSVFEDCSNLEKVCIPQNRQNITSGTFANCTKLKEINMPNTLIAIRSGAFQNCDALTEVAIPKNVTTIEERAFQDCNSLKIVTVPNAVTTLGSYAFQGCDVLESITLGTGLTAIPESCFADCGSLTSMTIPYNVTTIGSKAFANSPKMLEISIPRKTTSISSDAFSYKSRTTVYGATGSYAETFANENGMIFVAKDIPATQVKLNITKKSIGRNKNLQLVATIEPESYNGEIVWSSSDEQVAVVDENGLVTTKQYGTTEITVTAGEIKEVCHLTVTDGSNNSPVIDTENKTVTLTYAPENYNTGNEVYQQIYLIGNFPQCDWETGIPMTLDDNGNYTITLQGVETGDYYYQFKTNNGSVFKDANNTKFKGNQSYLFMLTTETKKEAQENGVNAVRFQLPEDWGTPVYCYVYDSETETVNNGSWPGEKMTKVEGTEDIFQYIIPENIKVPRVIFYYNNSKRYPPDDGGTGLLFVEQNVVYMFHQGVWEKTDIVITPTVTPTEVVKPTLTLEATEVPIITKKPTVTQTVTPGPTNEASATPNPTEVISVTPEPTEEASATPEPTEVVSATPKPTEEASATPEPTEVVSATPKPTEEASATPEPTEVVSATPEPTEEVSATPEPTEVVSATPEPTEEVSATPEPTEEVSATPEPTEEVSATPEPTEVVSATPELTEGASVTPEPTEVVSVTAEPTKEVEESITPKPTETEASATPEPTEKVEESITPKPTEVVSVTADPTKAEVSAVPKPTKIEENGNTQTTTITPQMTQKPNITPTVSPEPTKIPKEGTKLTDKKSKAVYRVTKAGLKNGTVEYVKTTDKKATKVTIPSTVKIDKITYKVTSIANNAFKGNETLKSISIGKNINTIGSKAFYKCTSLTKITIPSKVTKIDKQAFYGCKKLKTINIKTKKLNAKNVGSKAFKGIYSKATIKVPKSKVTAYKKMLKSKGISSKANVKK